jgi:hypothetical protein
MTYLIWDYEDRKLYNFESDSDTVELLCSLISSLFKNCYESHDFKIGVSEDGMTWHDFEYEICMSPSIYQTKYTVDVSDPRPQPSKL